MKILVIIALACAALAACSPSESQAQTAPSKIVEAACGECQFDLAGDSCDLAVRLDGQAYFVDGTSIADHGDAHGADGFCNAIRSARVTGQLKGDRFQVTEFQLLAE